ncbi:MAG: S41 family peptidase [Algibacter sp.]
MKNYKALILLLLVSFASTSCYNDIDDTPISGNEINDFVWKGMNSWYNWQSEVSDLSDSKDDNINEYQSYLNLFGNPEDLFNSLKYQTGDVDRFSWFIEDYIEQEQEFQGISTSFGMRLQSVQINSEGDVIFYVRYVADNSPASNANIKRGDIFNAINGVILTNATYDDASSNFSNETVTLSFVSENAGILTPIEDKTITSVVLSENPVHFSKIFDDIADRKVGYLVYNGFRSSFNDELNDAFTLFKNENINELILDLRLNGGGSVATSSYLASMIYANANEEIFASLQFNSKHEEEENGFYTFSNTLNVFNSNGDKTGEESINRLSTINRLYVLTSSSTASASEMIINGLKPYIPVKVIGTTTYGKNVGSITLYDSPLSDYEDKASANSGHLNAMQPIVFQIFNKNNESDYTQGFFPDIEVKEYEFWNNILLFGDENEVVLKAALDDIRGITTKTEPSKIGENSKILKTESLTRKFENEMYIDNQFFSN